jgi:hypothetical protein
MDKAMEKKTKPLFIVMSAPSGCGKSTLIDLLLQEYCDLQYSISCTTREPRGEEEDGIDYHFMPVERFKGRHLLNVHDTVCSQVATRHERLSKFALEHDVVIFVSGKASSNGKVLCDLCKSLNIRTYHIDSVGEIKREWFRADDKVGVCGATSTPKWLLEEVAEYILDLNKYVPAWEEKFIN